MSVSLLTDSRLKVIGGSPLMVRLGGEWSPVGTPAEPAITDVDWWALYDPATALAAYGDGGAVATWADSSGNGRDLAQGTADNQPTVDADGMNGNPALGFTDDFLANTDLSLPQPFTTVAIVKPAVADANQWIAATAAGTSAGAAQSSLGAGVWRLHNGSLLTGGAVVAETPTVVRWLSSGESSTIHVDGTQVASGNAGPAALSRLVVGRNGNGTGGQFAGELGLLAICEGDVTADPDWPSVAPLIAALAGTSGA